MNCEQADELIGAFVAGALPESDAAEFRAHIATCRLHADMVAELRDCIQQNLDWISQFHDVVFLFDQDDAGEQAAQECAALLPDRARIGRLPLKDANEMLMASREVELVRAIHEAQLFKSGESR